MKAWLSVLWVLTVGVTAALFWDSAMPSASAFLCLVVLTLVLAPAAFLLALALVFPRMRGKRLPLVIWLAGSVALLDAGYAAGQRAAQTCFERLQPSLESRVQNSKEPLFFYQGETRPNRQRYYVWCGAHTPPGFRVVIPRAQGWYEVWE